MNAQLFACRQMCKLRSVVVDISDKDVNGDGGIELRVTLVCHHHRHTVLAVLLPVQRHPVDDFTWKNRKTGQVRTHGCTWKQKPGFDATVLFLPVLALMRKNFPSESRMYDSWLFFPESLSVAVTLPTRPCGDDLSDTVK